MDKFRFSRMICCVWVFFKTFLYEKQGKKGVWTPPRGVSTAMFGDSLQDLTKKRPNVDMWTSCSLLIIQRRGVHISWGPFGGEVRVKIASEVYHLAPPNLGGPFWCPRLACLRSGRIEVDVSCVSVDSALCETYQDHRAEVEEGELGESLCPKVTSPQCVVLCCLCFP